VASVPVGTVGVSSIDYKKLGSLGALAKGIFEYPEEDLAGMKGRTVVLKVPGHGALKLTLYGGPAEQQKFFTQINSMLREN
jgi:hypothetical protein